jgi:hypothetical protein
MSEQETTSNTMETKPWMSADARIADAYNKVVERDAAVQPQGTETEDTIEVDGSHPVEPQANFQEFAEGSFDDPLLNTGNHKGFDYNKVMSELPDEAKMMLGNLRADYTRKTQELAAMRKQLEAEREAFVNSEFTQNLAEMASKEVKFDPYDDSSVEARIEKEVATRLQEMMRPLQTQYELNQRQAKLEQFKAEHPDLTDYKTDIAKLLMTDESLSLERAYYIVKGQKTVETKKAMEAELKEYKRAAKEYGLKVGGTQRATQNVVPESVRKQGGYAVYQWLQSRGKAS